MERGPKRFSGVRQAPSASYTFKKDVYEYDASQDFTLKKEDETPTGKKRKLIEVVSSEGVDASEKPTKKPKLIKSEDAEEPHPTEPEVAESEEVQVSKKVKKKQKKTPGGKKAAEVKEEDVSD
uniref:Uncharacterized protein n=1 Tax=Ditylenchus dipsaci TaxID=166011 RepID=A0A915D410_9BILA